MKLSALRLRSLQSRIVALFLLLILTVQLVSYTYIQESISANARRHAQAEIQVGERITRRLLEQSGQRLVQTAQVTANDFALREALATRDGPSVASALRRYGSRGGVDFAVVTGTDGRLIGETKFTSSGSHAPDVVSRYIERAARGGVPEPAIGLIGGKVYQIVATPVRSGAPMGWLVLGTELNERLVKDVAVLTALDASLGKRESGQSWRVLASTLASDRRDALGATLQTHYKESTSVVIDNDDVVQSLTFPLTSDSQERVVVVLQRSLAQAMAPFKELQAILLGLTAVGLLLSAVGSVLIAQRITGPLGTLVGAAQKIEQGDYGHVAVAVAADDEIGDLASAFNHMTHGIAAREQRITELAYADSLTGLPNRALFNERLVQAVSAAQQGNGPVAVLTLDLDRFKHVNDILGHHLGDLLLREVAFRFRSALQRGSDTVARIGGDEFAVLVPGEGAEGAALVALRIIEILAEPLTIDGHLVDVNASIGVAIFPQHGSDANMLMRHADVAMYRAKRGSGGFEVYDSRFDRSTPGRLSLLSELRHAVEHGDLTLYYQPKMDLSGKEAKAAEALVRWNHPERGVISPAKFIPFAEQTGYIRAITRKVLDEAFRQMTAWRACGLSVSVSVNISAHDLRSPDFPRYVAESARLQKAELSWLCLELTESAVMDDPERALEVLEQLREMGIRLSIDDFGTGYSSLAYLKRLPVSELKIDKSFVMGLARDRDDAAIVRSTIDMAHHMGLTVTAEGVEQASVLDRLRQLGCDMAQGYYVSPPVPADALARWIKQTTPREGMKMAAFH